MKKTSVYLSDDEVARLALLAEQEGVSQAEIVRAAIASYAPRHSHTSFRLVGSGSGPGDSAADLAEDELLAGFGE